MDDEKAGPSKNSSNGHKEHTSKRSVPVEDTHRNDRSNIIESSLNNIFTRLNISGAVVGHEESESEEQVAPDKVIDDLTFSGFLKHWKEKGFKRIITMVGAGISTSAGIPDFRTPGSGIYDKLERFNLPHPTAIFDLNYFLQKPKPFFALAKELYPGQFIPTPAHYFVRLLNQKGLLVRHYTQNIDTLERIAGIPEDKIVEAHGTFFTNHCLKCNKQYTKEWMKEKIFSDVLPRCDACAGIVKPDIVFFGENLPPKFHELPPKDFKNCDLLVVMGTSLEVHPFASLIEHAEPRCVRLLINLSTVGNQMRLLSLFGSGFHFDSPNNTRDIAFIGQCDDGVRQIAKALDWTDELETLIQQETALLKSSPAAPEQ